MRHYGIGVKKRKTTLDIYKRGHSCWTPGDKIVRYGLYRATRPKVTGASDERLEEQPSDLSNMSRKIELPSTAQDMPAQKGKPTRDEWDKLSKIEQWELIKNMDLKEATKGMSESERICYMENLQKVSDAVDRGAGYRILHYVTISGYINRPNSILS